MLYSSEIDRINGHTGRLGRRGSPGHRLYGWIRALRLPQDGGIEMCEHKKTLFRPAWSAVS